MAAQGTWFVVADQSRALVIRSTEDGLEQLKTFDEPAVRAHDGDIMTGERGRRRDQAGDGPRSAMDRQTPIQDTEVIPFAKSICDWLHNEEANNAFDTLMVIAAPQMLGHLREHIDTHANLSIADSIDKNVTSESLDQLEKRFRDTWPDHLVA